MPRSFPNFTQKIEPDPCQGVWEQLRMTFHDFAIFGESGSKFQSVNTKTSKTSQFFQFFGFQTFEEKHVNTKTSQLPSFFGFQEFEKKHVNTKPSQFFQFFGFQEFEKNISTPKLVNCPHFLDSRSLRKTCQHQN